MTRRLFGTALIALATAALVLIAAAPADAADLRQWRNGSRNYSLPFPRTARAQAVWDSDACWSDCAAHCTWGQHACLRVDPQGLCIAWTDSCDRYCQRTCRVSGGPLIDFTEY
jgi:hypothetical protein